MALIVCKFGGTSVSTPDRIRAAADRIAAIRAEGHAVAVVISAMGHTTDQLLGLAAAVAPGSASRCRRELDLILATGEQLAAGLLALALAEVGVPALALTGPQAEILTDQSHSDARIRGVRARRVRRALAARHVPVVAGFQGLSTSREVTTLGRGGSDTSAVALAIALRADRCDIYTDVDGVHTADPRIVPGARRHPRLSHREALMLAHAGAAVLHPRAAALAGAHDLSLRILSSPAFGPESGTRIEGAVPVEGPHVLGVTAAADTARLVLETPAHGAAPTAAVLRALGRARIPIESLDDRSTESGVRRMAIVLRAEHASMAEHMLREAAGDRTRIRTEPARTKVTVVGTGLASYGAALAAALQRLAREGIEPDGLNFSELGVTMYLAPEHAEHAIRILHDALFAANALDRAQRRAAGAANAAAPVHARDRRPA